MKNILKIVFVIIGTLIGAGFASGQEMYIFFFSYGLEGIAGLFVSNILMGIIIYVSLKIINKYKIKKYCFLIYYLSFLLRFSLPSIPNSGSL